MIFYSALIFLSSFDTLISVPLKYPWHITDECDQRCKHCCILTEGQAVDARGEQGNSLTVAPTAHSHPDLVTMNWEQMRRVFFNALEFCGKFGRNRFSCC